jgi:phosphoribosyl-ATP pyrophosphohydrolase/phosphoribosyl-AMP cyclohydrolase
MKVDFNKNNGLVPAIIQDDTTNKVLMLGYMNQEALEKTLKDGIVTFFSRSKKRLWVKGETSENYLKLVSIKTDCDKDTLLVKVNPTGPVCHTGTDTCWDEENKSDQVLFLKELEKVIQERKENPTEQSYTATLFEKGLKKISQKLGEEAVELIIEANDNKNDLFLEEAADLLYHYLVLLSAKDFSLNDVVEVLNNRREVITIL